MGEWRATTWGEEISLEYGKALRGYQDAVAPYRVYGTNGPVGFTDTPLAPGPGVILGRKGAYRGVHYSPEPFFVIDTAYYVKPKSPNDLSMRWLYYAIIHHKLGEIDDGSPIPSTTRAAVYVRDLKVPPIEEQEAIASVLGAFDNKIDLNRRMSATLEAMARALFKSWFVDFDPVRAKAEGRDPGVPPHLAALFPNRLVETEHGEIPDGWRWGTLSGFTDLNPEIWNKGTRPTAIKYVDLSNTKWGRIETIQSFASADAPSRAQRVLRPSDTIIGTVRPGNGSYAFIKRDGLTGSTGFAHLRPKLRETAELVYLAATAAQNIEALAHHADGAAYPAVRAEIVAATSVAIAPSALIAAFSQNAAPWLSRIAQCEEESSTLASLRDALLPRLISGELRPPKAETTVEAVA